MGKLTKLVKFARIGLILIQDESPHRVLDSPGGGGQFFQKMGGKWKVEFFRGEKQIFESIAKVATEAQVEPATSS